jgi:hypothetical protein
VASQIAVCAFLLLIACLVEAGRILSLALFIF